MHSHRSIDITPTRITVAYRLTRQKNNETYYKASRERWGIAFKTSGMTHYQQDGRTFLSDSRHVVLLPKGSCYSWKCEEPGECLIVNFDALETGTDICSIEVGNDLFLKNAFAKIEAFLSSNDPAGHFGAMQQLYGILHFLSNSLNKKYIPHSQKQILTPAVEYMDQNYADPGIRNEVLASLCGISVIYFRKCFKNVYGMAPMQYVHNLRLNKAKSLLLSASISIAEIAENTGYSNRYHFSKMFKLYTGVSPTDYIKSARQV